MTEVLFCLLLPPSPFPLHGALLFTSPSNSQRSFSGKDPEDPQVAGELSTQFTGIIAQYEVKLEKTNSPTQTYKGRPTAADQNITVSAVDEQVQEPATPAKFKGFKHTLPASITKKINRITIHGQVILGIEQLDQGTPITDKQYVFVYFPLKDSKPELDKPLLICLSQDGGVSPTNNKWYSRQTNLTWTDANKTNDYDQITPGPTISSQLAGKLKEIKDALPSGDTGYTPLDSILMDVSHLFYDYIGLIQLMTHLELILLHLVVIMLII